MGKKPLPQGAKTENWFLTREGKKHSIRRMVRLENGRRLSERYPSDKYKHLLSDESELNDLVIRLNGKNPTVLRLAEQDLINNAFVSEELLDQYQQYLYAHVPTRKDAETLFGYLRKYALNFFIHGLKIPNPLDWHRHQ